MDSTYESELARMPVASATTHRTLVIVLDLADPFGCDNASLERPPVVVIIVVVFGLFLFGLPVILGISRNVRMSLSSHTLPMARDWTGSGNAGRVVSSRTRCLETPAIAAISARPTSFGIVI